MEILTLLIIGAIFLAFIQFLRGPFLSDRILAFDTMGIITVSLLVVLSVTCKSEFYLDIAFVFALIGFIGTIVFARFNLNEGNDA
ncbi:MAG: monovalent cation/H+ antiporter complex subunit F [Campylobacterota bacterium]|nr:monovalent cation/H+ antiporter complex subunit F [Campylobacterota bacterium]